MSHTRWCALLFGLVLLLAFPVQADAHPGAGIVVDRNGTVYFVVAGASHLMKIRPGERATLFAIDERLRVPHHLTYGRDGFIYVASDDDGRVFRIDATGRVELHFDSRRAQRAASSTLQIGAWGDPFTVDSAGNVYALAKAGAPALVRISRDGEVVRIATRARMQPLHFRGMSMGPDGALYLSDSGRVWRIRGDSAEAIVPRGANLENPTGLVLDAAGNIYVADASTRRVVRLAPDGRVNTPLELARLRFRAPTGVALRHDTLYLLDNAPGSTAVWRVVRGDAERVYTQSFWKWHLRSVIAGMPFLLLALLVTDRYQKKRAARRSPAVASAAKTP